MILIGKSKRDMADLWFHDRVSYHEHFYDVNPNIHPDYTGNPYHGDYSLNDPMLATDQPFQHPIIAVFWGEKYIWPSRLTHDVVDTKLSFYEFHDYIPGTNTQPNHTVEYNEQEHALTIDIDSYRNEHNGLDDNNYLCDFNIYCPSWISFVDSRDTEVSRGSIVFTEGYHSPTENTVVIFDYAKDSVNNILQNVKFHVVGKHDKTITFKIYPNESYDDREGTITITEQYDQFRGMYTETSPIVYTIKQTHNKISFDSAKAIEFYDNNNSFAKPCDTYGPMTWRGGTGWVYFKIHGTDLLSSDKSCFGDYEFQTADSLTFACTNLSNDIKFDRPFYNLSTGIWSLPVTWVGINEGSSSYNYTGSIMAACSPSKADFKNLATSTISITQGVTPSVQQSQGVRSAVIGVTLGSDIRWTGTSYNTCIYTQNGKSAVVTPSPSYSYTIIQGSGAQVSQSGVITWEANNTGSERKIVVRVRCNEDQSKYYDITCTQSATTYDFSKAEIIFYSSDADNAVRLSPAVYMDAPAGGGNGAIYFKIFGKNGNGDTSYYTSSMGTPSINFVTSGITQVGTPVYNSNGTWTVNLKFDKNIAPDAIVTGTLYANSTLADYTDGGQSIIIPDGLSILGNDDSIAKNKTHVITVSVTDGATGDCNYIQNKGENGKSIKSLSYSFKLNESEVKPAIVKSFSVDRTTAAVIWTENKLNSERGGQSAAKPKPAVTIVCNEDTTKTYTVYPMQAKNGSINTNEREGGIIWQQIEWYDNETSLYPVHITSTNNNYVDSATHIPDITDNSTAYKPVNITNSGVTNKKYYFRIKGTRSYINKTSGSARTTTEYYTYGATDGIRANALWPEHSKNETPTGFIITKVESFSDRFCVQFNTPKNNYDDDIRLLSLSLIIKTPQSYFSDISTTDFIKLFPEANFKPALVVDQAGALEYEYKYEVDWNTIVFYNDSIATTECSKKTTNPVVYERKITDSQSTSNVINSFIVQGTLKTYRRKKSETSWPGTPYDDNTTVTLADNSLINIKSNKIDGEKLCEYKGKTLNEPYSHIQILQYNLDIVFQNSSVGVTVEIASTTEISGALKEDRSINCVWTNKSFDNVFILSVLSDNAVNWTTITMYDSQKGLLNNNTTQNTYCGQNRNGSSQRQYEYKFDQKQNDEFLTDQFLFTIDGMLTKDSGQTVKVNYNLDDQGTVTTGVFVNIQCNIPELSEYTQTVKAKTFGKLSDDRYLYCVNLPSLGVKNNNTATEEDTLYNLSFTIKKCKIQYYDVKEQSISDVCIVKRLPAVSESHVFEYVDKNLQNTGILYTNTVAKIQIRSNTTLTRVNDRTGINETHTLPLPLHINNIDGEEGDQPRILAWNGNDLGICTIYIPVSNTKDCLYEFEQFDQTNTACHKLQLLVPKYNAHTYAAYIDEVTSSGGNIQTTPTTPTISYGEPYIDVDCYRNPWSLSFNVYRDIYGSYSGAREIVSSNVIIEDGGSVCEALEVTPYTNPNNQYNTVYWHYYYIGYSISGNLITYDVVPLSADDKAKPGGRIVLNTGSYSTTYGLDVVIGGSTTSSWTKIKLYAPDYNLRKETSISF